MENIPLICDRKHFTLWGVKRHFIFNRPFKLIIYVILESKMVTWVLQIFVSSAYNAIFVSLDTHLNISLINRTNKRGPKIEPWGTPDLTGRVLEVTPPIKTCCCLLCKYTPLAYSINQFNKYCISSSFHF